MYRTTFLFLIFIVSCNSIPERNCTDFRTGTFQFTTTIEGSEQTTTFVRKPTIEIEEFKGKKDTASIRWINDCEYVLKKVSPQNRAEEKSIHIKILTTSDSSYTFEYNAIGDKRKFKGEAVKIH
ncbi:DNA topoisomerase IV [Allomuricauda sp. d1]|uniref:DNA topoisomerase IV n=1 Tax=Allomuricauda sp. d1 TaxID=3136725 RepID=UPI0031D2D8D5